MKYYVCDENRLCFGSHKEYIILLETINETRYNPYDNKALSDIDVRYAALRGSYFKVVDIFHKINRNEHIMCIGEYVVGKIITNEITFYNSIEGSMELNILREILKKYKITGVYSGYDMFSG